MLCSYFVLLIFRMSEHSLGQFCYDLRKYLGRIFNRIIFWHWTLYAYHFFCYVNFVCMICVAMNILTEPRNVSNEWLHCNTMMWGVCIHLNEMTNFKSLIGLFQPNAIWLHVEMTDFIWLECDIVALLRRIKCFRLIIILIQKSTLA